MGRPHVRIHVGGLAPRAHPIIRIEVALAGGLCGSLAGGGSWWEFGLWAVLTYAFLRWYWPPEDSCTTGQDN